MPHLTASGGLEVPMSVPFRGGSPAGDGRSSDSKVLLLDEPLAAMGARGSPDPRPDPGSARHRPDLHHLHRPHNCAQIVEVCDRVNIVEHGQVTFDKPASSTSLAELTDLMVTEYRKARKQIALEAGRSTVLKHKALGSRSPSFGAHDI
jgi:ABC-type sulfate/molybdate transport systems ATPase subunit